MIWMTVAGIATAPSAWGETYLVRPDGSGDFPTIAAAVQATLTGDTIILGDGTFTGPENRDLTIQLKDLSLRSESGDPSRCIIDCVGGKPEVSRALLMYRTATSIEGVTFVNGNGGIGGAVAAWQSSAEIRNCQFVGNVASESGALHFQESLAVVEDCLIANNVAFEYPGGGMLCMNASMIRMNRCTIVHNEAMGAGSLGPGGGIACWTNSSITIENSIIANSVQGEGVHCDETSSATITCSNVFGNAGGDWVGCLEDQLGLNGNISADPIFCDPELLDFTIREDSPCSPETSACGLMGALPVGCEALSIRPLSWGKTKARYRLVQ
jgi:hypothetical protein